ncbi:MAG: glycoside hydrolase [Treponema sp.]|jgi:alpha-D-xyloside xylohydrolase|nr:glycoside hydrolase [Treponema sp.]
MKKIIIKEYTEYSVDFPGGIGALTFKEAPEEPYLSIRLPYKGVYGTGERYDALNRKGRRTVNVVEEQFCNQGEHTYCPAPFFFTDSGFGLFVDTKRVCVFEFQKEIVVGFPGTGIEAFRETTLYLFTGSPTEIIAEYLSLLGPPRMIPRWSFGPWISANRWNRDAHVEEVLANLTKYRFPATVLVLEAWSDEATFYIFNGASYTPKGGGESFRYEEFDFSQSLYWKNPKAMIDRLHDADIRLILWQIPVYKKLEPQDSPCIQHEYDCSWAEEQGLCVSGSQGKPYDIPQGNWFAGSRIPDFTNPETQRLWFEKRRYLLEIGVDGFKTDGGEFIYQEDVYFHNRLSGGEMKNGYAQSYIAAYAGFLEDWREKTGTEKTLFSRAGYVGQHTTPILWTGDQKSTFEELRSQLRAGLSASLSGVIFWSFDIGGFAGPLPEAELYLRATGLACFCPVMQWHSEPESGQFGDSSQTGIGTNERSPWNIALVSGRGESFLEDLRFYHNLRMKLIPYLYEESCFCVENNAPLTRPLIYAYPQDKECLDIEDAFMLGRSVLVAPVLTAGCTVRRVWLPEGNWTGFFDSVSYQGGQWVEAGCSLSDSPDRMMPVFFKSGSKHPLKS